MRSRALPTDLKWQQASLALFLLCSAIGLFVNAAWLGEVHAVLFVVFLGSSWVSFQRGKRDTVRWTRDWVGAVER